MYCMPISCNFPKLSLRKMTIDLRIAKNIYSMHNDEDWQLGEVNSIKCSTKKLIKHYSFKCQAYLSYWQRRRVLRKVDTTTHLSNRKILLLSHRNKVSSWRAPWLIHFPSNNWKQPFERFRPRLHWNVWVASDVIWNKFHASHWNSFQSSANGWHETYFKWHLMPPTRFNVTEALPCIKKKTSLAAAIQIMNIDRWPQNTAYYIHTVTHLCMNAKLIFKFF